jgi:ribonuclease-3
LIYLKRIFKDRKHITPEIRKFEKVLKYRFKNIPLLITAITHRSTQSDPKNNYERLEFLGDSILDYRISNWLYKNNPIADEGELTFRRAALVNKHFLANMGKYLNILDFVITDSGVQLENEKVGIKIMADTYEAIVGAIFLDGGIRKACLFIDRTLIVHSDDAKHYKNYKGKLIEYCQKNNFGSPRFVLSESEGPEHDKIFTMQVNIGKEKMFTGQGTNKKAAEQNASKQAMEDFDI